MDFSTDLLRVIWHELGHFCIDIIVTDEYNEYQIDRFWVAYHEGATSAEKWEGQIRTMPSVNFEILVDDSNRTALAYISLISGCIFQTIFYNEFDEKEKGIGTCFDLGQNRAGRGDLEKFNGIGTEYRIKYGNREDFTLYINRDLIDTYYDLIASSIDFLNQLNLLAIRERDIILKEFQDAENKDDFYHHNDMESIENLRNEVLGILQNTGLYETIYNLKGQVREAIEQDIKDGGKK